MLWSVTYLKEGTSGAFEQGYQGRSRLLAWLDVQRLRSQGNDVEVWVRPDGTPTLRRYAMYSAFSFSRFP
jgi:hypothetical protein